MTAEGSLGASFIPLFTGYLRNRLGRRPGRSPSKVFLGHGRSAGHRGRAGRRFLATDHLPFHDFRRAPRRIGTWRFRSTGSFFPSIFFMGLAAVAAAILNSFHVFAIPASTSIFFNLTLHRVFVSAILYRPVLRFVPSGRLQTPAVALAHRHSGGDRRCNWRCKFRRSSSEGMQFPVACRSAIPGVKQFGRLMGPSFFGMGVYQINLFVDTIFATSSRMPSGSITSLYVADRVMQLVLGSYAIAMSTVLLPTMSHQLAAGKLDEMKHTFGFALRIVSFITIPAARGVDSAAEADHSGAISARAIRGGVDLADGERAALLFAGTAGVCGDQADHVRCTIRRRIR